jgi:hypothetical protein
MIEINGKQYLTEKEVSRKYGFSVPWFRKERTKKNKPPFCKLSKNGRVFYPLIETELWFQEKINMH